MFGLARQDDVEDHVVARILAFGGGDIGQGSALVGLKPRPYRVWGYPVLPALYLAALAALMMNTLSERPAESIAGLGLLLLGVPVYLFWKRRQPVAA